MKQKNERRMCVCEVYFMANFRSFGHYKAKSVDFI